MKTPSDTTGAVIVTGTSSGIGLATAVASARAGYRVVATVRDLARTDRLRAAADTAGVHLDIRRLDVTDEDSVRDCLDGVLADHGSLYALVNNAGAGHLGTLEQDDLDTLRRVFETNFFGVARVSRAAMPHLRAAQGRLIVVSSVGGVVGQPFNEAYCAAKSAVEGLVEALAPVASRMGVRVSVVEPGGVSTEFVTNIGDLDDRIEAAGPYADLLRAYIDTTRASLAAGQPAEEVGELITELLGQPAPPLRVQTSPAATAFVGTKLADLDGSAVERLVSGWLDDRR